MAVWSNKKGFTLVELLVSISIIGILTAIVLPNFMGARERAKDSQKVGDLNAMKNALRLYYNDRQAYPTGTAVMLGVGMSQYMPSIREIGYTYSYSRNADGEGFLITVGLEAGAGDDDVTSQTRCGLADPVDKVYAVCAN